MAIIDLLEKNRKKKKLPKSLRQKNIEAILSSGKEYNVNLFNAMLGGDFYCMSCYKRHKSAKTSLAKGCANKRIKMVLEDQLDNYPVYLWTIFERQQVIAMINAKYLKFLCAIDTELFPGLSSKIDSIKKSFELRHKQTTPSIEIKFEITKILTDRDNNQYILEAFNKRINLFKEFFDDYHKTTKQLEEIYKKETQKIKLPKKQILKILQNINISYFVQSCLWKGNPVWMCDREYHYDSRQKKVYAIVTYTNKDKETQKFKIYHNKKPIMIKGEGKPMINMVPAVSEYYL